MISFYSIVKLNYQRDVVSPLPKKLYCCLLFIAFIVHFRKEGGVGFGFKENKIIWHFWLYAGEQEQEMAGVSYQFECGHL